MARGQLVLLTEIRVVLCFGRRQPELVVILQQLIKEVYGFVRDIPLVFRGYKP
jgi:hypothetical protein